MNQHNSTTTNPRRPVEQGVTSMRSICRETLTSNEAIRVPLDVAEDISGRPDERRARASCAPLRRRCGDARGVTTDG